MKLKKRLDCGSNGFHFANIPKAPRSIRKKARFKKADEDGQTSAFELLASLARQLLEETENSSASSNASGNDHSSVGKETELKYEEKPVKKEFLDPGSCEVSAVVSESASQDGNRKCLLSEFPIPEDDHILYDASKAVGSGKIGGKLKSEIFKSDMPRRKVPANMGIEEVIENKAMKTGGLNADKVCISKTPTDLCMAFPPLTDSDKDVKSPSCKDPVPRASFSKHRNSIKLDSRDDDDYLSKFNKFSNKLKVYRPVTRMGDRRIRKLLTSSKYWKSTPKLKDFEHSRTDGGMRPLHRKRKSCYNQERYYRDILYKRRKFYDRSSIETFDGGFSCESVTNSPEKGRNEDKSNLGSMLQAVNGMTSSGKSHQGSIRSKDSNVKFRIKSFRVPEIFIEVSEATTVGSLKRTVLEAVNAILGGGLRVGVLKHGKKVRDDDRTLFQTGLSSEDNLDTLGFTLEPTASKAPAPPVCPPENPPLLLPDSPEPQHVKRSQETLAIDSELPISITDPPVLTKTETDVESNHKLAISHPDAVADITSLDSKAIVVVPAMNAEALAVVPLNQKSRRAEMAQRRTRRPFSVSEVESLVQAVEELGTGRWRDVKLRSFEHADHRTYVDLKDKWKTLVHTARISPQQRRGEPVPQDLLDRVLEAHAYWSQHQAKQQGKHQLGMLKIEPSTSTNPTESTDNHHQQL